MIGYLEGALEILMPLAMLALFAMALGLSLDNHAAQLDPASPYYVAAQ
jgi:ABC-type uncharacterized transport system ATPase component